MIWVGVPPPPVTSADPGGITFMLAVAVALGFGILVGYLAGRQNPPPAQPRRDCCRGKDPPEPPKKPSPEDVPDTIPDWLLRAARDLVHRG